MVLRLRPHHILDIVRNIGHDRPNLPHPYGHGVHLITEMMLADCSRQVELVVESDDICQPCVHLASDGRCDDVLPQCEAVVAKQDYNDRLDSGLLEYLQIRRGAVMSIREYLIIVKRNLDGVTKRCTHPKEDEAYRLAGLRQGLEKLGIE